MSAATLIHWSTEQNDLNRWARERARKAEAYRMSLNDSGLIPALLVPILTAEGKSSYWPVELEPCHSLKSRMRDEIESLKQAGAQADRSREPVHGYVRILRAQD